MNYIHSNKGVGHIVILIAAAVIAIAGLGYFAFASHQREYAKVNDPSSIYNEATSGGDSSGDNYLK